MSKSTLNIFSKNHNESIIKATDLITQMEDKGGIQYKILVKKLKEHQQDAISEKKEMHVTIQASKEFKVNGKTEINDEYIIDGSKKDSYIEYISSKIKFKAKDKKDAESFKNLLKSEEVIKRVENEDLITITGPITVIVKFLDTPKIIKFREYTVDLTQ